MSDENAADPPLDASRVQWIHGPAAFAVPARATVDLESGFSCSRVQKVGLRSTDSRELALSEIEGRLSLHRPFLKVNLC